MESEPDCPLLRRVKLEECAAALDSSPNRPLSENIPCPKAHFSEVHLFLEGESVRVAVRNRTNAAILIADTPIGLPEY